MKTRIARLSLMAVLALVVGLKAYSVTKQADDGGAPSSRVVMISDTKAAHILYGDERGGGHKFGVGAPCKSEFPQGWDDERILTVTKRVAANDNLDWEKQGNGYYVAEGVEDDIRVRVVLDGQRRHVITSYPVNVPRNPCPSNRSANDNTP